MAVSDPTHQYLLQCLTQSIPTDIATSIIISKSNPPYTSVLRAYTRNARFNTSSTPKPVIIITPFPPPLFVPKSLGFNSKFVAAAMITKGYLMFLINPYLFSICLNLRSVSVNMADETAWVDAGATLGELFYNIWKNSKVHGFREGVCPTVGVGGHLSDAGRFVGWSCRRC
ncbi:hypothetical protein Gotur_019278 [Gossypium turneri]